MGLINFIKEAGAYFFGAGAGTAVAATQAKPDRTRCLGFRAIRLEPDAQTGEDTVVVGVAHHRRLRGASEVELDARVRAEGQRHPRLRSPAAGAFVLLPVGGAACAQRAADACSARALLAALMTVVTGVQRGPSFHHRYRVEGNRA